MTNKLYRYFTAVVAAAGLCTATACNFVDIAPPNDRIITATLFREESTATSAVMGLYGRLVMPGSLFASGGTTIFTGLASDELYTTNPALTSYIQFQENRISVDNYEVYTNFWRAAYETVYQANLCMESLQASADLRESVRVQLMGECHFIRAFCYWYLLQLFGDVPLALTSDYRANSTLSRADSQDVKRQILADIKEALDRLPPGYPTEGKVRANRYTVLALLSRFHLYEENWEETEKLCSEILRSPLYVPETDIGRVFLIAGTESIWQLASGQPQFNSVEGAVFIPLALPTIRPLMALTDGLISDFEPGDRRRTAWVTSKTVQGTAYPYPFKYKVRQNATKTENYVVFRLAEVLLNRAEAYVHLERPQDALDDLNILRARADLPERTLVGTPDILEAIYRERRIELFAEWGHRWFDLRRTGRIDAVLGAAKPEWASTAAWFPIPQSERLVNINLSQNEGYNQ